MTALENATTTPGAGRPERLLIAERVAQRWNELGIRYAVLHGLESYPRDIGRDLDVLIKPGRVDEALVIVAEEVRRQGWTTLLETRSVTRSIIAFSPDGRSHLEIDSVGKLLWRSVAFCSSPHPASSVGPFQVDSWASAVKRIIMPFLSEGASRFAKRPGEQHLSAAEEAQVRRRLPALVRGFDAATFVSQLQGDDAGELAAFQTPLKKALLRRSLLRPLASTSAALWWLGRFAGGFVRPAGPIVVVDFEDGIDGQAVIDEAISGLSSIFTGSVHRKPASMAAPGLRQAIPVLLRTHRVHWSAVRLARFQRAVVLEGHPLLGLARLVTEGRKPSALQSFLLRLAPKPDTFLFVGGDAERAGGPEGLRITRCALDEAVDVLPSRLLEAFVRKNPVSL
jgi:hypothetical protein